LFKSKYYLTDSNKQIIAEKFKIKINFLAKYVLIQFTVNIKIVSVSVAIQKYFSPGKQV